MSAPGKQTSSGMYATPSGPGRQTRKVEPTTTGLVSVVLRLPRAKRDALDKLAADTRVRKSEYLREALADVLAKHGEKLDGAP